ncbi:alpha 1,3-fucosyltransferase, putative [Ixodes scapularis]|uniref:Fucosyltransferase n=1 Tax=Ixodes scapularis TaxID=6945 RepID=B7PGH3_IXOSC|nr:alpha 1,3-fucosyltransferase, putative [Ixodes scapularis]|eukprot:XP_002434295.1 alpha 1,3-fucosyltransferase, putative [Ixodes scapularis]
MEPFEIQIRGARSAWSSIWSVPRNRCYIVVSIIGALLLFTLVPLIVELARKHIPPSNYIPAELHQWKTWRERPQGKELAAPRILIWFSPDFHRPEETRLLVKGQLPTRWCPQKPGRRLCYVTKDHSYLETSDVLVFAASNVDEHSLPHSRHQLQPWVFWTRDRAPLNLPPALGLVSSQFNWTMSYRADSDIVLPYMSFTSKQVSSVPADFQALWKQKSRLAVWLLSDCEPALRVDDNIVDKSSSSEDYTKEVIKAVETHVYRKCGADHCGVWDGCLSSLQHEFHFLFVMESSACFEDPTEIIYDAFKYDILPVYFGRRDISARLPPNSFYDTTNAASAFEIIDALLHISKNFDRYNSYMAWKARYELVPAEDDLCLLCDRMHQKIEQHVMQPNIVGWWKSRRDCSAAPDVLTHDVDIDNVGS